MTSILPSLLTSATATPSERNTVSRTVFFQVISDAAAGVGWTVWGAVDGAERAAKGGANKAPARSQ